MHETPGATPSEGAAWCDLLVQFRREMTLEQRVEYALLTQEFTSRDGQ